MGALRKSSCEVNLAGPEEDCGRHVTYHPCGKSPTWTVETDRQEFQACEQHVNEALCDGGVRSAVGPDGEEFVLEEAS